MKTTLNQHKNSRGFIQFPLLIIALITLTISGVTGGYYITKQIKKTDTGQVVTVATTTEETMISKEPIDFSQYEINNAKKESQDTFTKNESENDRPTFSFQEKIRPVIPKENNTEEEAPTKILAWLGSDIEELNAILKEIKRSRERYIDFALDASKQREQSLLSLLPIAPDAELKNFIQKGINTQQERLADIRNDYETLFGFIEDGLEEYIENVSNAREELSIGNEVDELFDYIIGGNKEIDRFLNLLNEVNKMANNREKVYAEAYTEYLGYIKNLNAVAQTGYSILTELDDIERSAMEQPKSLEINCWSTTETVGGFFSGKSQTTFRCE